MKKNKIPRFTTVSVLNKCYPTVEHLEEEERLVQRGPSLLTAKMGQMECLIARIVIKGNCA